MVAGNVVGCVVVIVCVCVYVQACLKTGNISHQLTPHQTGVQQNGTDENDVKMKMKMIIFWDEHAHAHTTATTVYSTSLHFPSVSIVFLFPQGLHQWPTVSAADFKMY